MKYRHVWYLIAMIWLATSDKENATMHFIAFGIAMVAYLLAMLMEDRTAS